MSQSRRAGLLVVAALLAVASAAGDRQLLQKKKDKPCEIDGDWLGCCRVKEWINDPNCPPVECGVLQGASLYECCSYKGGSDQDPSCPRLEDDALACQNQGPDRWWQCCVDLDMDASKDTTCPVPSKQCSKLNGDGCNKCCSFYGRSNCGCPIDDSLDDDSDDDSSTDDGEDEVTNAQSIPAPPPPEPPCSTTGPENYWQCCSTKSPAQDSSCPPPNCGELAAGYDECCAAKNYYPNDPTCYIRLCYNFNITSEIVTDIVNEATHTMALALADNNATSILEIAKTSFQQLFEVMTGTSSSYNSTIMM